VLNRPPTTKTWLIALAIFWLIALAIPAALILYHMYVG